MELSMEISDDIEFFGQRSDAVTKQYESSPYPPFEEKELNNEDQFYKNNKYKKSFLRSNVLYIINHYLHRGKESFR